MPTVEEARLLCRFRGGRLPTDAEWERAARGPDGLRSIDASTPERVCLGGCEASTGLGARDVGDAGPGPGGLVDAFGNLWEWTDDCHWRDRNGHVRDGQTDPFTPWSPGCRGTLRGGSFRSAWVGGVERRASQEGLRDAAVETRGVRCAYLAPGSPTPVELPIERLPLPERTTLGN